MVVERTHLRVIVCLFVFQITGQDLILQLVFLFLSNKLIHLVN